MVVYSGEFPTEDFSPLQPLLDRIAECPGLIAPERELDLGEVMKVTPWTYVVHGTDGARGISASLEEGVINLPLAQLERLWAMTYGFLLGFDIGRKHASGTEVGIDDCPELKIPMHMLSWAYEGLKARKRMPWPDYLPRPGNQKGVDEETLEKVNRHFLGAVGFIILHEIAHLHLRHPLPKFQSEEESIRCEREADAWAAAWIMEQCPPHTDTRIFRADVCVLALSLMNLLEFSDGPQVGKQTHPPTVERLLEFSAAHVQESGGQVAEIGDFPLFFAASILHTQRLNLGLDVAPGVKHDSMTDYFVNALRVFRERQVAAP